MKHTVEPNPQQEAFEALKDLRCAKSHLAAFKADPALYGKLAGAINAAIGILRPLAEGK